MINQSPPETSRWITLLVIGLLTVFIVFGWLVSWPKSRHVCDFLEVESASEKDGAKQPASCRESVARFGDSFAPLTGLMTIFALAFTARSLHLQSVELQHARTEAMAARTQARTQQIFMRRGYELDARRQLVELDRLGVELCRSHYGNNGLPQTKWRELVETQGGPLPHDPPPDICAMVELRNQTDEIVKQWAAVQHDADSAAS